MGDPSSSQPPKRQGPRNSTQLIEAASGSFPHPFALRNTPRRYTNRPSSSMAYHHRRNRNCSPVRCHSSPASGPSGWRRFSDIQSRTAQPRVRLSSGRPAGRISTGSPTAPPYTWCRLGSTIVAATPKVAASDPAATLLLAGFDQSCHETQSGAVGPGPYARCRVGFDQGGDVRRHELVGPGRYTDPAGSDRRPCETHSPSVGPGVYAGSASAAMRR